MSSYLDGDTADFCIQYLRNGGELDELSGRPHIADAELLGSLLQLPTVKPAASNNVESEFGYDTMAMESYVMACKRRAVPPKA